MKITSKGQVTIPIELRKQFGLLPNTEVTFEARGGTVRIRKVRTGARPGPALVSHMRGKATSRLSTDEILSLTRR